MGKKQHKKIVILVDTNDKQIGTHEKLLVHQYAMLHRAFSIFIFRKKNKKTELLLQQRNINKYHAGGLWTNTCCGHPQPGETIKKSAQTRLNEEMGFVVPLKEVGVFHYVATFDNGLYENEIDHVFIGTYDQDEIPVNPDEVEDYRWVSIPDLKKDLAKNNKKYTPWFKQALELALTKSR